MSSEKHIELLKKLVNGTISVEEKWALERSSLDDPFLAEAIEGYYDNRFNEQDVNAIVFNKKSKTINLRTVLSVAASLAVLLAVSYFFFNQSSELTHAPVSMHEEVPVEPMAAELQADIEIQRKETQNTEARDAAVDTDIREDKMQAQQLIEQFQYPGAGTSIAVASEKAEVREVRSYQGIQPVGNLPQARKSKVSEGAMNLMESRADLELSNTQGIATDENGNTMTGTEIKVHEQPELSIQLKREEGNLSGESQVQEIGMTDEELVTVYRGRLDKIFNAEQIRCLLPKEKPMIRVRITTDINNTIKQLEFLDAIDEECRAEIQVIFENARLKNVFSANREISFLYDIRQ